MIKWFQEDPVARNALLADIMRSILTACGKNKTTELTNDDLDLLLEALIAWVDGKPLRDIEGILGGEPDAPSSTKKMCPRAREIAGTIIPRGISFAIGLIAHMIEDVDPYEQQPGLDRQLIECLGTLVRKGYNQTSLLMFAAEKKAIQGRVQMHNLWQDHLKSLFGRD